MDTPEKIWCLMARVLNGEASLKDHEELGEVLSQDYSLQQQFDVLSRIWSERKGHFLQEDSDAAKSTISRIIDRAEMEGRHIEVNPSKKPYRKIWLAAASFLVLATLGGWFWKNSHSAARPRDTAKGETLEARKGSRSRSLLPDGTTVWLNAGSTLHYSDDFSGATREVMLEGEAFFDVIKQPQRPFIVHTSGIDIKVLGTAFNVKAYPEDKTVETTLYRGAVQVYREGSPEHAPIRLRPNEKLILPKLIADGPSPHDIGPAGVKQSSSYTIAHIDSTKKESERLETAWLYSRLEFRGERFEDLAKKMERWYNVKIILTDEKVRQLTVTGSFENETVEQAFEALKTGLPGITYKIIDHEIYVGTSE